jgi:hypothetical protein
VLTNRSVVVRTTMLVRSSSSATSTGDSRPKKVLGVISDDGATVAFPVAATRAELGASRPVVALGIVVVVDASGVRATREDGTEVVGHEAFWFAWSQFHPDTVVWAAP